MMKKIVVSLIVIMLSSALSWSQTPTGFSYQAVLRNSSGQVLVSQSCQLRITLTSSNGLTTHYQEIHNISSSAQGLVNVIIGNGTGKVGVLTDVPWGNDQIMLKTEIKVGSASVFTDLGSQPLQAVPYALYASNAKEVESSPSATDEEPIFVVKNKLGQIVFAVYQTGVRVFVEDGTTGVKGAKGGFAVGGLSGTKLSSEYFRITSDSARIYINENSSKGTKGGFAVGGLSGTKSTSEYLSITPDSTRIYVNDRVKGAKGGFAVGGLSGTKMQRNFVQLLSDNYFIGQDAGKSILNGQYNIFIGHQAGANTTGFHEDMEPTDGDNNIFLGYRAGYSNILGQQNIYLGAFSGEKNANGESNTFVGAESGKNNTGYGNTYIGAQTGGVSSTGNTGYKNTFIGHWSGDRNTSGNGNVFIGRECGSNNTTGYDNVYIGHLAGHDNATGYGNVFIGPFAGWYSNLSNKLIIHNNGDAQVNIPTNSLIYGDFSAKNLRFNANLGINVAPNSTYGLNIDVGNASNASSGVYSSSNYMGFWGIASGSSTSQFRYGIYATASGGVYNYGVYGYAAVASNSYAGYFNGNVYISGILNVNGTTYSSDRNLKKNIQPLSGALSKIINLRGVTYEWRSEQELSNIKRGRDSNLKETENSHNFPKGRQIGVIAQEVEEIFPELVSTDGDGLKSVDYVKFTPLLIEAVKEQQSLIDKQQKEIDLLKSELEAIKALLRK